MSTKFFSRSSARVLIGMVIFVIVGMTSINAHAAMVPSLSLSLMNNNTQIQVTVIGADPNAAVVFYYPSTSSILSTNLGVTNASGNFTTVINPAGYNVTVGASTYVMVDGSQSQAVSWPNYTNQQTGTTGYITLSQSSLNLTVGQGNSVTVSSSITNYGTLSIPSNTNSAVASVSLSGNQIVINGLSVGSTNITVCAVNAGCATLFVNVQQSNSAGTSQTTSSSPSTISFSQSTINMTVGQSQTVSMSGPGYFYVSSNSNLNIASTNVNGSVLTINAIQAGNTTLSVCSAGGGSTSCGAVNVIVSSTGTANTSTASTTVYVTPNNVSLSIGQTQTVALTSSQNEVGATYYVNSNSNPNIATVNINGTNALVSASASGGDNVSICAVGGNNCANLYVYVTQNSSGTTPITNVTTTPLSLTSFSISSNNVNNTFMGAGDVLTFTFNANQIITTPTVTINGSQIAVYGSNAGPYTIVYTMTGTESLPLSITLNLTNASGATTAQVFTLRNSSSSSNTLSTTVTPVTTNTTTTANTSTTAVNCPVGMVCMPTATPVPSESVVNATTVSTVPSNTSSYTFNNYLYEGINKIGQSNPDVVALQNRLITDGFLSAGSNTGYFGPLTKTAVQKYQTANGLQSLGVVGPATRNLLNQGL